MIESLLTLPIYITMPVALIGYSTACLGIGLLVWNALIRLSLRPSGISAGTILTTAFILGQGILASLWLLLALAGLFTIQIVAPLSVVFAISGLYIGKSILVSFIRQATTIWRELRADTWGWQLIAGLTVFLCLMWFTSLSRPLNGDGSAFYFAFSKLIAFSHQMMHLPGYEGFTNVGLQGEMHFAALMLLRSPEAAKLFSWPTITAAGFMLASLARVTGMGRRGQWLTLSILFSSSAVIWLSGDGKTDLFGVALGLAAYYWAVQVRYNHRRLTLFLTGLFSGFAFVAKLSYIPVMVPGIALLVLWGYEEEFRNKSGWKNSLKSFLGGSLVIMAGLIVAITPHLIKNGFLFHNPISPFGSGGIGWLNQNFFGEEVTRRIVLTYPFALTYGSYWAQYGNLSPLILAFLPLTFFLPRPRSFFSRPLFIITLAALAGLAVWLFLNPSVLAPRYILAMLMLLSLLPARAAEHISLTDSHPRFLAFSVTVFTAVVLASTALYHLNFIFFPDSTIPFLTGSFSECTRDGVYCSSMNKINKDALQGERILLSSYQHYWLRGDLLQCLLRVEDLSQNTYGDDLWVEIYEHGFSYIFIDKYSHSSSLEMLNVNNPPTWVELTPIFDQSNVLVYQIKFIDPPNGIKRSICKRIPSSRIWEVSP